MRSETKRLISRHTRTDHMREEEEDDHPSRPTIRSIRLCMPCNSFHAYMLQRAEEIGTRGYRYRLENQARLCRALATSSEPTIATNK